MATNNSINARSSGYAVYDGAGTWSGRTFQAGTGISITNGDGTGGNTTINTTGGGFTWTEVTGTSQSAAVNNGYIASNGSLVTVTLPTTAAIGDAVWVVGKGAGGWKLAQNASQFINYGSTTTTTGAGGSLASTNQYDAVAVICTTANNGWTVPGISQGNLTVV